ncbi:hypothetical protein QBC37DRAFT_206202 [Rhypophila decipiens]|uniref:Uncharacterized protein n=1 Tax=Rhypophila decipiens TaxID=261697 RepID=A0AAN6Y5P6_9PEZI|nr:hypothetical protein QBC37DRAFT_206202 [Rhypophila decipiens]
MTVAGIFCGLFSRKKKSKKNAIPPFKIDIIILRNGSEPQLPAVALLDTQCQKGNWISSRLVERLGVSDQVRTDIEAVEVWDANGKPVKACGAVDLVWRPHPNGERNHWCRFYVLPRSGDKFDIILGADFIHANGLLLLNLPALLTLTEHEKIKKKEQLDIAAAKKRQAEEKAELEARRKQREKDIEAGHQDGQSS